MKIVNAKQIIKPSRVFSGQTIYWYENSNIIDNQIILCGHTKPDKHSTTKLYYHKIGTSTYDMILEDWCNSKKIGLEDAHIAKVGSWYYLSAEGKAYSGHQKNIYTFKSKRLNGGWVECPNLTIRPTSKPFENYSMSSPVNYYKGDGILIQYYECRNYDHSPIINGIKYYIAKIAYALIDTKTDTIKYRATSPISNIDRVPDDVCFKDGWWLHSVHGYDFKADRAWFGEVFKSREFNKNLQFAYKQTYNGKTVGEIYFTDSNKVRFWESNQGGMYEGYLEQGTVQPPTGEGMNFKVIELPNNRVRFTWTANENVHFEDDIQGYFKTCGIEYGGVYQFENKKGATKFRARKNSGIYGDWISIDMVEPPIIIPPIDPPDPDCDHSTAISYINTAITYLNKAKGEL